MYFFSLCVGHYKIGLMAICMWSVENGPFKTLFSRMCTQVHMSVGSGMCVWRSEVNLGPYFSGAIHLVCKAGSLV